MTSERFEHKDITPAQRPEHPGPTTIERARSSLFFNLIERALSNFQANKKEEPTASDEIISSVEFFFKKEWDAFAEFLLEYDDLERSLREGNWASKGEESRAVNELKKKRDATLDKIEVLVPNFRNLLQDERKKVLARIYEGFASYIEAVKLQLEAAAPEIGEEDKSYSLFRLLQPMSDEALRATIQKHRRRVGEDAVSKDPLVDESPQE